MLYGFQGITFGDYIINICTQSYAWMEFDLDGNSQSSFYTKNSKRLEEALSLVSGKIGINPQYDSETDYAYVKGFKVFNHIDIDGEVMTKK